MKTISLAELSEKCAIARKARRADELTQASEFNIFRLLKSEKNELAHSDFLGCLLDPKGDHGQGDLFLSSFLALLFSKNPDVQVFKAGSQFTDWTVVREKSTSWGRLDLIIRSNRASVLVAIENKISAPETGDQVSRYAKWRSRQIRYTTRLLGFLTLAGQPSSSKRENFTLSYRDDIRNWLTGILPEVRPSRIREIILQYLRSLPLEDIAMEPPDELTRLLAKPKNVEMAFDVGTRMLRVKTLLFNEFYAAIRDAVAVALPAKDLKQYEIYAADYSEKWAAVSLLPRERNKGRPYAYWRIEKTASSGDGGIAYGVATEGKASKLQGDRFQKLLLKLEQLGFDERNPSWVLRKRTEHDLSDVRFWVTISAQQAEIVSDIATQFVALFQETRGLVESLNSFAAKSLARID